MTETRRLTEQQKKEYIEHKGMRCPVCKSSDITADTQPDVTEDGIFINCACMACQEEWVDQYKLTDVDLAEAVDGMGFLDKRLDDENSFDMEDEFEAEEGLYEDAHTDDEIGHADDDWKDDLHHGEDPLGII